MRKLYNLFPSIMNLFTNIYYLMFTFFEFILLFELVFISLYDDISKKNIGAKLLINLSIYTIFILYNISEGFLGGIIVPIILIFLHILYFIYYLLRRRRVNSYSYKANSFIRFKFDSKSDVDDDYPDELPNVLSPTLSYDDMYDSPDEL